MREYLGHLNFLGNFALCEDIILWGQLSLLGLIFQIWQKIVKWKGFLGPFLTWSYLPCFLRFANRPALHWLEGNPQVIAYHPLLGPWGPFRQTARQAVEHCGVVLHPRLHVLLWPRVNTELVPLWAPSALADCTSYPNNVRRKKRFPLCKSLFPNYFTI